MAGSKKVSFKISSHTFRTKNKIKSKISPQIKLIPHLTIKQPIRNLNYSKTLSSNFLILWSVPHQAHPNSSKFGNQKLWPPTSPSPPPNSYLAPTPCKPPLTISYGRPTPKKISWQFGNGTKRKLCSDFL